MRSDLDNAHNDMRQLREHEESWDASRFQLEAKLREHEGDVQRLRLSLTNLESDKHVCFSSIINKRYFGCKYLSIDQEYYNQKRFFTQNT